MDKNTELSNAWKIYQPSQIQNRTSRITCTVQLVALHRTGENIGAAVLSLRADVDGSFGESSIRNILYYSPPSWTAD